MLEPNLAGSATVRLWTFQGSEIAPALSAEQAYRALWSHAPANWQIAYQWMAERLAATTGTVFDSAPIWCWHSCNGHLGAPPSVGTAAFLLSEYQLDGGMVAIELDVPVELVLLSSYSDWNRFLDFVIRHQRLPKNRRRAQRMFAEPLLKHDTDDIQAVISRIEPAWVQRVNPLTLAGRNWEEPLLPGV